MITRRIGIFLGVTFAVTWGSLWLLVYLMGIGAVTLTDPAGIMLFVLAGFGPAAGAYASLRLTGNAHDLKDFHRRLFKVKLHWKWYLAAFLLPMAAGALGLLSGLIYSPGLLETHTILPVYQFFLILPAAILFGGIEELGWRGFALPELLQRFNVYTVTVMLAVIWGFWHLPLFMIQGTSQYETHLLPFVLIGFGVAAMLSWLYIKTESIFLCVMFHAAFNAWAGIGLFAPADHFGANMTFALLLIVAGLFFLRWATPEKPAEKAA
ncbi:CPBP family intramembrane glutamic endopeptidase [Salisediminibacterium beveridgei]|uniref:Protease, CAAX amino terminal protease family n=1 Tax=Salisediminibacterium beveridgei TaxID=632773 RepID=A0A1D7QZE6_9BACI|nr:type II CAAX endopeptidase family protein [Salisediminibacterium beveridgei]AOM84376.1 protease, CAAX amino terminal protease family [Salisediminibacterium beveridgei]